MLLSEEEFARLIGLSQHVERGDDAQKAAQMVTVPLIQSGEDAKFTLHLSPEEHFAIQLRVGDFARL